ncbi:DUF1707 domain-containing protein [Streptomyces sp. NPDC005900]|uniref:DUF1707 SHOCT-like domain-containing protein n=1 Tax=Streptomyces sp. NPDC005900 TaxID=3154569 RepID=UPI00340D22D4
MDPPIPDADPPIPDADPPIPDADRSVQDVDPPVREGERDTALQQLQDAYAEGHLSHEEMDARLDRVLTADTRSRLVSALASLPAMSAGTTSTITAASGRIRRRGAWRVPRSLKVESAFAAVRLDLSRAVIEHAVTDIELRLGTTTAKIIVPRDALVDIDGLHTGWKDSPYNAPRRARPGGPRIRVSGSMGFSRLKIRHARR